MISSGESSDNKEDDDYDDEDPQFKAIMKRDGSKVEFITNHVVSTIDALGMSDYKAARLLMAVAQSLGYELNDLNVSRSTIRRRRVENRKLVAETVKLNFKVNFCFCL